MQAHKAQLRKQLLTVRKSLPMAVVDDLSLSICEKAFATIDWSTVRSVCTYEPAPGSGEVDTAPLLSMLSQLPHPPQVTMVEPHANAPMPQGDFDVIIVPVVGFDEQNQRLGQGGGWYDRFLATQPRARTIGLAHAVAKTTFPHEPHDIPLDVIVTERQSQSIRT